MRSPAERALRALAFAALALALFLAIRAQRQRPGVRTLRPAELPAVLAGAARPLDTIALVADTALDPVYRDWLAAARNGGRSVRWTGDSIPALAIAVEPSGDPAGGSRVLVAAPAGALLRLADSAGALDSARASQGGVSFAVPPLLGRARVGSGSHGALAELGDSLLARRIVLLGRPSWETKFVLAALEERGWRVDARIPLTPDTAVIQGSRSLDTSGVAAVVALDASAVPEARRIAAYVRQGGGLILGPGAAWEPAFAPLRAGRVGARRAAPLLEVPAADPRRGLALAPVVAAANDALALERRDDDVAVAGRRIGAGRVLQLGYEDTWRWRMTGPEGAVEAHRKWWSSLVGSVAYRATLGAAPGVSRHDAPRARMVARLGPEDPVLRSAPLPARAGSEGPAWWLCALALASLLAEWASRRLRGAP